MADNFDFDNNNLQADANAASAAPETKKSQNDGFKFFKNCSLSLKRFSVLIFAVNIFITIVAAVVGTVAIFANLGAELFSVLILPIVTALLISVLIARFISALKYRFAELVEKHEK